MTHDELLKRIDKIITGVTNEGLQNTIYMKSFIIIRALVELHRPVDRSDEQDKSDLRCFHCTHGYEFYPCPTIDAIEEQLK